MRLAPDVEINAPSVAVLGDPAPQSIPERVALHFILDTVRNAVVGDDRDAAHPVAGFRFRHQAILVARLVDSPPDDALDHWLSAALDVLNRGQHSGAIICHRTTICLEDDSMGG